MYQMLAALRHFCVTTWLHMSISLEMTQFVKTAKECRFRSVSQMFSESESLSTFYRLLFSNRYSGKPYTLEQPFYSNIKQQLQV